MNLCCPLGLYEKAMPNDMTWEERLLLARELKFAFIELSIDESNERIERLNWTQQERQTIITLMQKIRMPLQSLCLSAHRRFPFGSIQPHIIRLVEPHSYTILQLVLYSKYRLIQFEWIYFACERCVVQQ